MTLEAYQLGDWQAVIDAHPLESHDPQEWLRYGVALLQTMEPGPDVGKQHQRAALAFVQAEKEGATKEEVLAAQRQSVLLSVQDALKISGLPNLKENTEPYCRVQILHLHGFKCAGSTFIWALERATAGQVAYLESDQPNRRLPWQRVSQHLRTGRHQPKAITSHLVCLPPQDEVSLLKVAFLRRPLARLLSAYRYETRVRNKYNQLSLERYIRRHRSGVLANYQTRHLSPQQEEDWHDVRGWGARPELIDLERPDLFVGLVERYDESMVALEQMLQSLGIRLDLAYPRAMNTTRSDQDVESQADALPRKLLLESTELDERLYQRVEARLDEHINSIPQFDKCLQDFHVRCQELSESSIGIKIKPPQKWTRLSVAES